MTVVRAVSRKLGELSHHAVGRVILPRQKHLLASDDIQVSSIKRGAFLEINGGEIIKAKAEDHVELEALFFHGVDPISKLQVPRDENSVILFCGLGMEPYDFENVLNHYRNKGCNVALFNYRGTGTSEGEASPEGMVLDGVALVDYIHHQHGVPYTHIALHGYSLGGGPSAEVAVRREGVAIVNDRSYSKLSVAAYGLPNFFVPYLRPIRWLASVISSTAVASSKWDFDTETNWSRIRGKKCIVYHPKDEIIVLEASLFKAIFGKDSETLVVEFDDDQVGFAHTMPLNARQIDAIIQQIFPKRMHVPKAPSLVEKIIEKLSGFGKYISIQNPFRCPAG
jgi:hypothetical protein